MGDFISNAQDNNFLLAFNGQLSDLKLKCKKVSVPGVSMSAIEDQRSGVNTREPSGAIDFDPVVVEFFVDADLSNWTALFNWIEEMSQTNDRNELFVDFSVLIPMLAGVNSGAVELTFKTAWAAILSAFDLDAALRGDDVLCSLTLYFNDFSVKLVK
jgi:hypothetical protein